MMRGVLLGAAAGVALLLACTHGATPPPVPGTPAGTATTGPGGDFEVVRQVLQHPRCQNCHPAGDAPLQGDDSHLHPQAVVRGVDGHGAPAARCSTCHGKANPPSSYGRNQPPGVSTDWHLPPPAQRMVFVGRDARGLCEQLKDPARNGGKDLAGLLAHVSGDPLVLWGWAPGEGRAAVPTPHATFVAAFRRWIDAGAPCGPGPDRVTAR